MQGKKIKKKGFQEKKKLLSSKEKKTRDTSQ